MLLSLFRQSCERAPEGDVKGMERERHSGARSLVRLTSAVAVALPHRCFSRADLPSLGGRG